MTREQFAIGCVILVAAAIVSLLAGIWWGRRDGADEIAALEADLEAAIARHPAGKRRGLTRDEMVRSMQARGYSFEEPAIEPTSVIPPGESDTAWTRRMGMELEAWLAAMMAESEPWLREMTR